MRTEVQNQGRYKKTHDPRCRPGTWRVHPIGIAPSTINALSIEGAFRADPGSAGHDAMRASLSEKCPFGCFYPCQE